MRNHGGARMKLDIPRWTFLLGMAACLVLGTDRPSTAQTDPCPETTRILSDSCRPAVIGARSSRSAT